MQHQIEIVSQIVNNPGKWRRPSPKIFLYRFLVSVHRTKIENQADVDAHSNYSQMKWAGLRRR